MLGEARSRLALPGSRGRGCLEVTQKVTGAWGSVRSLLSARRAWCTQGSRLRAGRVGRPGLSCRYTLLPDAHVQSAAPSWAPLPLPPAKAESDCVTVF